MKGFGPETFGERYAEVYDDDLGRADTDATARFLRRLAGEGRALELAVGTGRVALALAATGVQVDGVEISPEMVAKLRAKHGGEQLSVTLGDFAAVPVAGKYSLVFVVFNTIFNLVSQDDQVRCFCNVASHLADDGCFVIEAFVPDSRWLGQDQYLATEATGIDEVVLETWRHDRVAQTLDKVHLRLRTDDVRLYPVVLRYSWPSELDLMARLAGLRLKERWGGWCGEQFGPHSKNHVSVYGR
ncbi:MAG: class I SAM-dependent DNA methyltransferase [Acidimicrobiales bacterium]